MSDELETTALTPPPQAPVPVLTEAQKANQVYTWILSGASDFDIAEAITASFPGSDPLPLLKAAIARIHDAAKLDPQTVLGFCFEATRDMYRRMVEVGDFAGACRAIRQMRDLIK